MYLMLNSLYSSKFTLILRVSYLTENGLILNNRSVRIYRECVSGECQMQKKR